MQKEEIHNLIKGLINKITEVSGDIVVTEEGTSKITTWFSVETKTPYLFLNRDGEALVALNHLARRIVEAKTPSPFRHSPLAGGENPALPREGFWEGHSIMIDINGYQKKKIENIKNIVHMMAERARYFKSNIEIDPMSSYERRIVHEFLSDATDLQTESQGVGHSRRVVIKYIGNI